MLNSSYLTYLLAIIAIAQAIIIAVALVKSSLERKNSNLLAETNSDLEARIKDRTESLRSINNRLYKEITRHQATSQDLVKAKRYLNLIIDRMPSIIIAYDANLVITHWNTLAEQTFNKAAKSLVGKPLTQILSLLSPVDEELEQAATDGMSVSHKELKITINDDQRVVDLMLYPLLLKGAFVGGVIRIDDVTLRTKLELMVVQNEKMSSLGQLAAGLAHEINNPLGAILQSIQTIERRFDRDLAKNRQTADQLGTSIDDIACYVEDRQIGQFLQNIQEAGTRAADIINSMLGFSRMGGDIAPAAINTVIKDSIKILSMSRGDNGEPLLAQTELTLNNQATNDIVIDINVARIQQVIINLITNAIHACQQADRQVIAIELVTTCTDDHLSVSVRDNGAGIEPQYINQLFEPFFTTKETGKGTGLGLSISYFIICTQHAGRLEAKNRPTGGAEFVFTLPRR